MRILGIDPGYAIVGYGIVDYTAGRFAAVHYGAVLTAADAPFEQRILKIYTELELVIEKYKPDALSIEQLFFTTNQKTAIAVSQARGVILLAAVKNGIPIYEYTPLQVKQAVVGYGKAVKQQVMEMTRIILNLEKIPKPDDTADALAIAICHAHCSGSLISRTNRISTAKKPLSWEDLYSDKK